MIDKEKIDNFLIDIINKMFSIAGYNISYEDIKDRKDDWYAQYTMTTSQYEEWKQYVIEEIKKRFKLSKKLATKEFDMISLNYSLKIKDN